MTASLLPGPMTVAAGSPLSASTDRGLDATDADCVLKHDEGTACRITLGRNRAL
jgi:hypothetical protein